MVKKPTLIYDASQIAGGLNKNRSRTGIYMVAYNILQKLVESDKFDISLYSTYLDNRFHDFVKQNFGNLPIYTNNKYAKTLSQMAVLNDKLRADKHNILKLLLNIFARKPLKFIGKCVRLPYFDVAFSPLYGINSRIHAKHKYVFLHDAIPLLFPEYYPQMKINKYWFCDFVKDIKRKPNWKYFANSIATKDDFIKLLNITAEDIIVTPLAASDNFHNVTDKQEINGARNKYNIPTNKKYVFSLCTLEPRKNLIRAVKTFIDFITKNNIDDMVFVLGGGHWDEFIGKLESSINDLGKYKDKIIRAGYIDDADLAALYSGAEWFVYTSQYEGFGLPPLEAMKCGCPVITSNNSSLPEVVGDAAITIDWDSDEQHITAYETYYNNPELRKTMSAKGIERAKKFSWEQTTNLIIQGIQNNA